MNDLQQLAQRLNRAIFRKRVVLIIAGLIGLISTMLAISLALSSLAALFIIPVPVKIGLMILGVGMVAYALYRFVVIPIRSERGIHRAALQIERNHPDLKGRLIAALQFRDLDLNNINFSKALIDMTGRQATELTDHIDFNEIVSGYPVYRKLRSGAIIGGLALILGLLVPGFFSNAIDVYSQPTTRVAPPPGFALKVLPGSAEKVKYSDIEIGGRLIGAGFPGKVEIFYKFAEGRWQSEDVELPKRETFALNQIDSLPFAIKLKQVRRSLDYYVVAGDIRSATYAISIVERPRVTGLKVAIDYPDYTGLPDMALDENNGSFAALVGSRVVLEVDANRDISDGALIIDHDNRIGIDFDGSHGSTGFTVDKDFSYFIRLKDAGGEENPDPIEYTVTAVPDEFPSITVLYPGFDVNLDENMLIPFRLQISDDFGFNSLVLKYQVISGNRKGAENVAVINFSDNIETEGEVSFNWDLDGFNLLPSDYILYHFELADNDRISGPKVTSTRVFAARLPSIDEIVMQSEMEQEERVEETRKILKEQREMADKLQQMAQEIQSQENLDWQKKKELENILEKQQQASDRLDKMADEMKESLQKMEKNNLLSEQILQKLQELQKLFNEVATKEMKEAMKRMQEALKEMNQEELEEAIKEFQLSQEEMLKRLERSVDLLKRLQVQQKMAAMLKMAEEMLLEQNRINVESEEASNDADNQRLAQRENQVSKQMTALKKESDKLDTMVGESPFKDSELHKKFSNAVRENDATGSISQTENSLKEGQLSQASSSGQEASEQMQKMASQMRQIMENLADQEGEQMAAEIRKALDDTNYLSQKQEDILNKTGASDRNTDAVAKLAVEQQILREATAGLQQRIVTLSKKSPFLAAELMQYLNATKEGMSGACDNLGDRQTRPSIRYQRDAIYNLNRTAIGLLDGLENQKQCNKGGSCNNSSAKMNSICQKQNQINQETKGSCSNPGSNQGNNRQLGEAQKAAMKRLAGEQGVVRKSLEELQNEFGDRREILGRLDALSNEVKKIEEMLDEGQVGQDLIDRQLKVYSRMLDMQKSLSRRDYTRERKAVTAQDILRASPGPLDNDNVQMTETLQERLNRHLQEGYPRQYEQQIKAYFKAISNSATNGAQDK